MAIKKQITFEGHTYNLDERDKVGASAVRSQLYPATGAAAGGSAAGTLAGGRYSGTVTIGTQIQSGNTFTVTFGTAFDETPHCVASGLTNYTTAATTTALTITGTGNSGTGVIHYVCL
tara:strand:+ start:168 stop:521 length:354 start_codon:yes stop_codon:yes gene_type:complete